VTREKPGKQRGRSKAKQRLEIRQHHGLTVFLLLAGAFLLRLPNLGESLWYDEVIYTSMHLKGPSFVRVLFYDVHPPLYPLVMRGWIEFFGDGEIVVRLPSLLFGLLSIGLLYTLAQRWFGRTAGILAAALMALSPVHIWYSQEAKTNMLLLLLCLLTIYALDKAWMDNRPRSWILFIGAALAALCTNRFALWTVAAAFVWLWLQMFRDDGRSRLRWTLISSGAVALGYLPLFVKALLQMNVIERGYLRPFTLSELYPLYLVYLSHGNTLRTISPYEPFSQLTGQPWAYFLIDGFFAFLIGLGVFVLVRRVVTSYRQPSPENVRNREIAELLLLCLLVPPIALIAASYVHPEIYIERSMIILLPMLAVLFSVGIVELRHKWQRNILAAALLSLSIAALYNLWVVKADVWTVYKPNPDWRSAAKYLVEENSGSSEQFFVLSTTKNDALSYNYSRLVNPRTQKTGDALPQELPGGYFATYDEAKFVDFLTQYQVRTLFLVHNQYWSGNFEDVHNSIQRSRFYELLGEKDFGGLEIYKYRTLIQRQ